MRTAAEPSPLAAAALALVGDEATASDLSARFGGAGAAVDEPTAERLLEELCVLGLARSVRSERDRPRYLMTPLGQRLVSLSVVGPSEQVDLLAELEQMRTDLVSTIAHELRTPLTAVRTSVGLLLDGAIEPSADERRNLLETIDRNANRMQRVVGDILDLARFRVGGVQLQLRRFDARELARSAIASMAPLADSRGHELRLDAPPRPVWVFGDFRRLEQALINLVSNADKYSPRGAPIDVSVEAAGEDVHWTVVDRGRGIDEADQARLFERFFVARGDGTESVAGIGLGLPITLAIVQAHDGRIDVQSRPGEGSTFSLLVPAAGPRRVPTE